METNDKYKEKEVAATENYPYYNPAPEVIVSGKPTEQLPIVSSGLIYKDNDGEMTEESLKMAREAGFNVCEQQALGSSYIRTSLQNAINAKVKLIFGSAVLSCTNSKGGAWGEQCDGVNSLIPIKGVNCDKDSKDCWYPREGFGGIFLQDEPNMKELENTDTANQDCLWYKYQKLLRQNPECLLYINLNGSQGDYDKDENGVIIINQDYKDYVKKYQELYKPGFFCYDIYPISEINNLIFSGLIHLDGKEGTFNVDQLFYPDLEYFSEISKKYDRPFWAFCQGMYHIEWGKSKRCLPIAMEQFLRYEAFTALAYGAKGIVYWTYGMSVNGGSSSNISSLLNRRNERTASWYFAKKINEEIKRYQEIFLNGRLVDRYKGKHFKFNDSNIWISIDTFFRGSTIPENIVVTTFKLHSEIYFLVVNGNPLKFTKISITLNECSLLELTPEKSGKADSTIIDVATIKKTIIPGGYKIFKLL